MRHGLSKYAVGAIALFLGASTALAQELGDDELPGVIAALGAASSDQRAEAADVLGSRATAHKQAVTGPLRRMAREDSDWRVRASAIRALGRLEIRQGLPEIVRGLRDEHAEVRVVSAAAIWRIPDPVAYPALVRGLGDSDAVVRQWAAVALGSFGDRRAIRDLLPHLDDPADETCVEVIRSLRRLEGREALDPLRALAVDEARSVLVRTEAIDAMAALSPAFRADLERLLGVRDARVRSHVAKRFAEHGVAEDVPVLRRALRRERSPRVRRELTAAVAAAGNRPNAPPPPR